MTTLKSNTLIVATALVLASLIAPPASATSTAPLKGDMAVSFNAGLANAFDDDFDGLEPVLTGTFEYYTSPRLSWRGLLGVMSFDADQPGSPSVDTTFLTANALHNWERGKFHPYVTGGIGLYDKSASSSLPPDLDETTFGVNAGGGIDWFLGDRWALEFEGTFHGLTGEDPDTFFLGTAGVKFWF